MTQLEWDYYYESLPVEYYAKQWVTEAPTVPVKLKMTRYSKLDIKFNNKLHDYCSKRLDAIERLQGNIYLFGSCARGDARGSSDIDIAIILDEELPRRERLMFYEEDDSFPNVNPIFIMCCNWDVDKYKLHANIKREGIIWKDLKQYLSL